MIFYPTDPRMISATWITFAGAELPIVVSFESLAEEFVDFLATEAEDEAVDAVSDYLSQQDDLAAEALETVDGVKKIVGRASSIANVIATVVTLDLNIILDRIEVEVERDLEYEWYDNCVLQGSDSVNLEAEDAWEWQDPAGIAFIADAGGGEFELDPVAVNNMNDTIDDAIDKLNTKTENKKAEIENDICSE